MTRRLDDSTFVCVEPLDGKPPKPRELGGVDAAKTLSFPAAATRGSGSKYSIEYILYIRSGDVIVLRRRQ